MMNEQASRLKKGVEVLNTPLQLRNITIKNRIIRSATYEGYGDSRGFPGPGLGNLYSALACGGVGAIITGFVFISPAGRAMQPRQCGIDSNDKIAPWYKIAARVRETAPDVRLFMQIAHSGRQTRQGITHHPVVGVSSKKCSYFKQGITVLDDNSINSIIDRFAEAAGRAQDASFDGVQVHAAHGYLIHQFLSPWTNTRRDRWADGPLFLEKIIQRIRRQCGNAFPILVKLSCLEDNTPGIRVENTIRTVKRLENLSIDAVEISYGTMEYALNIIRGACPVDLVLEVNPLFNRIPTFLQKLWKMFAAPGYIKRFIPFKENYNVPSAERIKKETSLPIIPVGGIRTAESMVNCISSSGLDAVSLCRPLICEPGLPGKIIRGAANKSRCINCNRCTIYCDSTNTLRCYRDNQYRENKQGINNHENS